MDIPARPSIMMIIDNEKAINFARFILVDELIDDIS
jgi:hypothetical protein